ncbi:transcriptional regulator [Rhodococcus rhodnii]|uniref:Transcriptional regulator n=2 Tax=Rhodococcus rhodnii TaxID=38312 RepID=R7WQ48_9NOCA|nr:Rrf2 family transcriptional regulator [Rhodococcus rhodnii]EOM77451.1 hypothetical protein Rrhod_1128 [Rhodococcus rhodnii LMG 5362]TXG90332.1 transcriptional regulator [Rhodococcus rhodnii]
MQFTRTTELGLRLAMILAAAAATGDRVTVGRIAARLGTSERQITDVVAALAQHGVVDGRRGRGGGIALTEHGHTIDIGVLARSLDATADVADCPGHGPSCTACGLRRLLTAAREAAYRELDGHTLAELAASPTARPLQLRAR